MAPRRSAAVALVAASVVALTAGAGPLDAAGAQDRPTLVAAIPCFSPITNAELRGAGWTPGGQVRLRGRYVSGGSGEALDLTLTADASGGIQFNSTVPDDAAVTRGVAVTAEDLTRAAAGAGVEQRQANTTFRLTYHGPFYRPWNTVGPARGRPGRRARLEASGYIDDLTDVLYAHYIRNGDSTFHTTRVGRLRGVCGGLSVRFREFDFRPVRRGTYRIFFDTSPVTSDNTFESAGYRRVVVR